MCCTRLTICYLANPLALDDRAPRTGLHVYKRQLRPKLLYKVKIPKATATILKRYVAAVSPATKKRFQTTFLIREATKLAADIQHADPASIHGGNKFVLCRKLASLLPAEYCTQKSKNLLNDLVVAAIRFFKANGRQPKGTFKNSSTSDQPEPHPGEAEDAVRSQPLKSASSQADENGVAELEELPEVPGDMLNSRQASTDSQVLTTQTGRSPNQTSDSESIPASTITDTTRSDQTGRKAMTGNKISKKRKRSETHEAYADGEITDSPKLKKSKKESKKKVKKASTENGREHVQLQDSYRAAPKSTSTASPDTTIIAKNSNKIAQPVSAPAKKPFTTPLSTTAGAVQDRPEKRKMHRLERAVRELNGEDFSDESSSSNSSSDSEDETPRMRLQPLRNLDPAQVLGQRGPLRPQIRTKHQSWNLMVIRKLSLFQRRSAPRPRLLLRWCPR